ncbi:hypothetical protein D3C75_1286580 [compost metagenome]
MRQNGVLSTRITALPSNRAEAALSGRSVLWMVVKGDSGASSINSSIYPLSRIPSTLMEAKRLVTSSTSPSLTSPFI